MSSKFIGYVVTYRILCSQHMLGFLKVVDETKLLGEPVYSLETATLFETKAEAEVWGNANPRLIQDNSNNGFYLNVAEVWEKTERTLHNPTPKPRTPPSDFIAHVKKQMGIS